MKEIAIKVQNVSVCYRSMNHMSIHQSLLSNRKEKRNERIEAVRNVSFTVEKGEIVGIVGKNGSGKSTLLRAVGGIFQPDEGSIDISDNRISLMAIGVGFKSEVSGRENIISSGLLMGYTLEYIQSKMDEIIEFSELGHFIDRPVRTYSSGMYSKLSFAVTSVLETDIMLIDEVLSVGDEHFKKKSYKKMQEMIMDREKTVLIVTHNLEMLDKLCDRVIWLHEGKIRRIGEPKAVLAEYEEFMNY